LAGYLKARGIKTVFVTGLATDFCVAWTAMDARKAGFDVYVIEDATRAIDLNGSLAAAWKQMAAKGVKRIQSSDLESVWARRASRSTGDASNSRRPARRRSCMCCAMSWA